jgi:hypothetical protein
MADGKAAGRPRSELEMIITSIAAANDCVVVTDNEKDFADIAFVNPLRADPQCMGLQITPLAKQTPRRRIQFLCCLANAISAQSKTTRTRRQKMLQILRGAPRSTAEFACDNFPRRTCQNIQNFV